MEPTRARMLRTRVAVSAFAGAADIAAAPPAELVMSVAGIDAGPWLLLSGCVCCILTVAFGSAGPLLFGASLGRVILAVSFFGETGLAITPDGGGGGAEMELAGGGGGIVPEGGDGGPGLSGIVGLLVRDGGFGGGIIPVGGFAIDEGGAGGPGGLGGGGGGGVTLEAGMVTFEVSFLGA